MSYPPPPGGPGGAYPQGQGGWASPPPPPPQQPQHPQRPQPQPQPGGVPYPPQAVPGHYGYPPQPPASAPGWHTAPHPPYPQQHPGGAGGHGGGDQGGGSGLKKAVIGVVVLAVLAVLGIGGLAVYQALGGGALPTAAGGAQGEQLLSPDDIEELLDGRSKALRSGDEDTYLAPFAGDAKGTQKHLFENLRKIPFTQAEYSVLKTTGTGTDEYGDGATVALDVAFVHKIQDVDVRPVSEWYRWIIKRESKDAEPRITRVGPPRAPTAPRVMCSTRLPGTSTRTCTSSRRPTR